MTIAGSSDVGMHTGQGDVLVKSGNATTVKALAGVRIAAARSVHVASDNNFTAVSHVGSTEIMASDDIAISSRGGPLTLDAASEVKASASQAIGVKAGTDIVLYAAKLLKTVGLQS
eukprot:COSAG01_NODE_52683_length_345_cov_0.532520_1_plen_115_part_11